MPPWTRSSPTAGNGRPVRVAGWPTNTEGCWGRGCAVLWSSADVGACCVGCAFVRRGVHGADGWALCRRRVLARGCEMSGAHACITDTDKKQDVR
jgi:hypothetical protein